MPSAKADLPFDDPQRRAQHEHRRANKVIVMTGAAPGDRASYSTRAPIEGEDPAVERTPVIGSFSSPWMNSRPGESSSEWLSSLIRLI